MNPLKYANVVVDINSSHVDFEYEYIVSSEFVPFIKVGSRVGVPFTNNNRLVLGYVTELYEEKRFEGETKEIEVLLDYEPLINDEQIQLARAIKADTVSTLVSALNLMVPKKLRLKVNKYLYINDYEKLDADLALIIKGRQLVKYDNKFKGYAYKISKEIKNGNIEIRYNLNERGNIKVIKKYVIDQNNYDPDLIKSKKQRDFLERFSTNTIPLTVDQIVERYEVSEWIINKLIKVKYLKEIVEEVSRIKKRDFKYENIHIEYDPEVKKVIEKVEDSPKPTLIHIQNDQDEIKQLIGLVKSCLKKGKRTLVVVPNVILVYKIASLLNRKIDAEIITFSGKITDGEFYDSYLAVVRNQVDVVVTSPVGAFVPLTDIGLIVMLDEENDSYYNSQSPRYDLHQVLKFRADYHSSKLVLFSVAPSIVSYTKGLRNHYQLLTSETKDYYQTYVVDLVEELKRGNRRPLSNSLALAINDNLNKNYQSMLILNTRGYSKFVLCRECGQAIKCPKCGLSLSYYQHNNKLKCAACGYQKVFNHECPNCQSKYIRHMGLGIEQLMEYLREAFPNARLTSIDDDSFEVIAEKMASISDGEVDIIVAPDVIARVLIEPNIKLVGILALDLLLSMPSYLANEKAFSMLMHASYHISNKPEGKLFIQTYQPQHFILRPFITNDYRSFYNQELDIREAGFNEPFYEVNKILIKGPIKQCFQTGDLIKKVLIDLIKKDVFVLGPSYNYREQAVQLVVKHQSKDINRIYQIIYEKYQTSKLLIIFHKYATEIS